MELDGRSEMLVDHAEDGPLLLPNDLCFGPDGMLYFTDSGIRYTDFVRGGKVRDDYETVGYVGRVYRLHPESLELTLLDADIKFTNGLALGPGDRHLYVCESITGEILRYEWCPGGIDAPEVFSNTSAQECPGGHQGPWWHGIRQER